MTEKERQNRVIDTHRQGDIDRDRERETEQRDRHTQTERIITSHP